MIDNKDLCFVIMPYGEWFDHYYKDIYKKAILNAGLLPKRADELFTSSSVIDDIWNLTKKAKIILADLTGKNPNVFYELGLAHALAKPALLVSESMDDVPFDLRHLRVITYDKNNEDWGNKLSSDITSAIKETLSSPEKSVLPTFIKSDDVDSRVLDNPEKAELRNLKYEVNYIKNTLEQIIRPTNVSIQNKGGKRPPENEINKLIRAGIKKEVPDSRIIQRIMKFSIPLAEAEKRLEQIKSKMKTS